MEQCLQLFRQFATFEAFIYFSRKDGSNIVSYQVTRTPLIVFSNVKEKTFGGTELEDGVK